jgi:hypothetical protein
VDQTPSTRGMRVLPPDDSHRSGLTEDGPKAAKLLHRWGRRLLHVVAPSPEAAVGSGSGAVAVERRVARPLERVAAKEDPHHAQQHAHQERHAPAPRQHRL